MLNLKEKLDRFYIQQEELMKDITKTRIQIAKQEGEVVSSIDDLICPKHSPTSFIIIGEIPFSKEKFGKALKVYECASCKEGNENPKTGAYDCPDCGVVYGNPKHHYTPGLNEFSIFWCSICDKELRKECPLPEIF